MRSGVAVVVRATVTKGLHAARVRPGLPPFAARSVFSSATAAVADAATKRILSSALDTLAVAAASDVPRVGYISTLDADTEYDVRQWKSIVDVPVVEGSGWGDSALGAELLYPPTAPSLAALRAAGIDDGGAFLASAPGSGSEMTLNLARYPGAASLDPFAVAAPDLAGLNDSIKALLGVDHPVLETVARYFFSGSGGAGKKIRPALVMLMAHACNAHMAAGADGRYVASGAFVPSPAERAAAVYVPAHGLPALVRASDASGAGGGPLPAQVALPLQRRLAEISELIHTASLLHDDVLDSADVRRGVGSVNAVFGSKLAVLAGDFLLSRACVCLARLRNIPAVELLSTVIEHLVRGEVMQMHAGGAGGAGAGVGAAATAGSSDAAAALDASRAAFDSYLRKTYYKTGSLMANSCKAIALLGHYPEAVWTPAYRYGLHLGIAFQLIDDLLDFEGTLASLGKPALSDVSQGLATAPVLYAAHRFPAQMWPLVQRKFSRPGDVDSAVAAVAASGGVALTRRLAIAHGELALSAISELVDSPARTALAALVGKVVARSH